MLLSPACQSCKARRCAPCMLAIPPPRSVPSRPSRGRRTKAKASRLPCCPRNRHRRQRAGRGGQMVQDQRHGRPVFRTHGVFAHIRSRGGGRSRRGQSPVPAGPGGVVSGNRQRHGSRWPRYRASELLRQPGRQAGFPAEHDGMRCRIHSLDPGRSRRVHDRGHFDSGDTKRNNQWRVFNRDNSEGTKKRKAPAKLYGL